MTAPRFAARTDLLRFSSSQAAIRRIREARAAGQTVHDFSSKFDTPAHIKAAAIAYLESPRAALYADPRGIPELRAAIARKLRRENALAADPETEITVSPGGKQGILTALQALVGPGDEVILEDPGWLSFEPMVRITGAEPIVASLHESDGFALRLDELEKAVTPRTRALVLCNPHNPTGRVMDRADLEMVARFAQAYDLVVVMDEAYEHFLFDGCRHVSLAAIEGMRDRTVTAQTASKTFNMFGWRIGWLVASPEISERIQRVSVHSVTSVTSFAQAGAAAALDGTIVQGTLTLAELMTAYQAQRDTMMAGLRDIRGVTCVLPRGAYFAFPNISRFGLTSQLMSQRLFAEARISANPGSIFGARGEGHLRFVFNAQLAEIEAGLIALRRFLSAF